MVRGCAVLHTGLGGRAVSGPDAGDLSSALAKELRNFQEITHCLMPERGEVPRLAGIDVWGSTRALRGAVGGDHLIYVDFKQRYDLQARIAEAEARGAADGRGWIAALRPPGGHRRARRGGAPDDRRPAGRNDSPGVPARGAVRARPVWADHDPAVREPEHAAVPLVGRAQVRVSSLRGRFPRRGRSGSFRPGSPCRASSRRVSTDSSTSRLIGGCRRRLSASSRRCK